MATTQPTVKQTGTIKINKKGQFTIPKPYREALGIETGASFSLLPMGDGLMLLPDLSKFNQLGEAIATTLANAGITEADLQRTLPEARRRVFERRYPNLAKAEKNRRGAKSRGR